MTKWANAEEDADATQEDATCKTSFVSLWGGVTRPF